MEYFGFVGEIWENFENFEKFWIFEISKFWKCWDFQKNSKFSKFRDFPKKIFRRKISDFKNNIFSKKHFLGQNFARNQKITLRKPCDHFNDTKTSARERAIRRFHPKITHRPPGLKHGRCLAAVRVSGVSGSAGPVWGSGGPYRRFLNNLRHP